MQDKMLYYNVEVNRSLFHISRCIRLLVCCIHITIMHCALVSTFLNEY